MEESFTKGVSRDMFPNQFFSRFQSFCESKEREREEKGGERALFLGFGKGTILLSSIKNTKNFVNTKRALSAR